MYVYYVFAIDIDADGVVMTNTILKTLHQKKLWTDLLGIRVRLQPLLELGNRLPNSEAHGLFHDHSDELDDMRLLAPIVRVPLASIRTTPPPLISLAEEPAVVGALGSPYVV